MNYKLTIAIALGLVPIGAQAASQVTGLNFRLGGENANATPVVNNVNERLPVSEGLGWAVGTFPADFDFESLSTTSDDLRVRDAFSQSGGDGLFNSAIPGFFSATVQEVDPDGLLSGTSGLYFVIANNTDVSMGTDFIVFRSDGNFPVQDPETNTGSGTYSVFFESGELVYGTEVADIDVSGASAAFASFTNGVTFDAVPEPSTSLLAGLAGLVLAVRRRR